MRNKIAKLEYDREYNRRNYERKLELNRQWKKRTGYKTDRQKAIVATRKWQAANPEKVKRSRWVRHLRGNYGLTPEQYNTIWLAQELKCAACGESDCFKFHVDHDHSTGVVRGILCHNCNISIGMAKESVIRLKSLIEYLEKHSST